MGEIDLDHRQTAALHGNAVAEPHVIKALGLGQLQTNSPRFGLQGPELRFGFD